MFLKLLFLAILFSIENPSDALTGNPFGNYTYNKVFYETGRTKAEGWVKNGVKEGYWRFYHPNGILAEKGHYKNGRRNSYWFFFTCSGAPQQEGHYTNDKMADWWLFYDSKGRIDHKCQLTDGKKNGYCLKYTNEILTAAEKYSNGTKIKKWTSFTSFKRENKLSDLK